MFRALRWAARPRQLLLLALLLLVVILAGLNLQAWIDFRAAREAYAATEYNRADRKIHDALRVWFWRPSVHIWAARIARSRYDFAAAEAELDEARRHGADVESLQVEWLMMRINGGELDAMAAGLLKSIDEGHPKSGYILETMARQYMRELRFQEARYCLTRWLEREPDTVRALDWRGWVEERLQMAEEAQTDYERVLQLNPGRMEVRKRLAYLLLEKAKPQEALVELEALIRNDPKSTELRTALANCRFQLGQRDEARQSLEEVLQDDPDYLPAMGLLAKIEQLSVNYAEAEKLCRRVLVKTPFDTDVHYTLFRSLSDQGKPEAVAEEQRYKQLVEYRQRVDVLIQQMDRSKDKPDALAELGNLLINLGQEEEGLHWLGMALKRDPNHARTHEILAAYYDSHGEPAKAAEHRKNISSP